MPSRKVTDYAELTSPAVALGGTTINGTDTFDAGSINVIYQG